MSPRHGKSHAFTVKPYPGFGPLAQPLLYVHLRSAEGQPWTSRIAALVDTGASITLVKDEYARQLLGFDLKELGPPLTWSSATGTGTCRLANLDLRLGLESELDAPVLERTPVYFTDARLPEAILLGQRGVLDRIGLVHRNHRPTPEFRFVHPSESAYRLR